MIQQSLKETILKNNEDEKLFIEAIFCNMGIQTALFLCRIAPVLREEGDMSATALGKLFYVTPGAALYHLNALRQKNFVVRPGYRSWELGDAYFEHEANLKKKEQVKNGN